MKTIIAFVLVILASVAAAVILTIDYNRTKHFASKNRQLIHQISKSGISIKALEKANRASCQNFTILKHAVNKFHSTIRGFLLAALKARLQLARRDRGVRRKIDIRTARDYKKLLRNTHTVKAVCAQHR